MQDREPSSSADPTRDALRIAARMATRAVKRRLRAELGGWGLVRVALRIGWAKLRGEPFARLGPPVDRRDRLSRRQCGDAVLLDRAIRAVAGKELAHAVTRDAVLAGGVPFLELMIPPLPAGDLGAFAREVAGRFFNAEGEARADEETRTFTLTVNRCRFVELLLAAGAPHLMPLFCEVDEVFFARDDSPVSLDRGTTLATGGTVCDFRFSQRDSTHR